jgi:hypothetical protein
MFNAADRFVDFDLLTDCLWVNALSVDDFELSGVSFEQHHALRDQHLPHHREEDGAKDKLQINRRINDITEFKQGNNIGNSSATPDRGAKALLGCRVGFL